ncbi:MAG TPA: hypothetical protein VNT55_22685, partial [Baekduia sp.]|nr:hypothetical protein [Baekduia sp.]
APCRFSGEPMPHAPNRRLVLIVRLVFYPVAIGLIAVALHARLADADGGAGFVRVLPAPPPSPVTIAGTGAHGDPVTATMLQGKPTGMAVPVHFRCTPDRGDVWAVFDETPDTATGGRLRIDDRDIATTWPSGWRGRTDLRVSGTYTATSITATVSGRLTLHAGHRPVARCRARAVRLVLAKAKAQERRGSNAQGELVYVRLVGRNVQQLSSILHVACRGGDAAPAVRTVYWLRVVRAGSGRLHGPTTSTTIRQTAAVTLDGAGGITLGLDDLPERANAGDSGENAASNQADVRLDAHGVLRGRISSTVTLGGGGAGQGTVCQTPAGGVSFALPARPAAGR